jgi:hypothetical protein
MKRILMTGLALALSSGIALAQTATNGSATYRNNTAPSGNVLLGAVDQAPMMSFGVHTYNERPELARRDQAARAKSPAPFDQMTDGSIEGGSN